MRQLPALAVRRPAIRPGTLAKWIAGILSVALLLYVLGGIAHQMIVAPPALRLLLVHDVPLPSGLGTTSAGTHDPLAPGVTVPFDRFDFQAYDPQTHLLFIAHTGPNTLRLDQAHIKYDPATDGHIVVFDTLRQQVVGRVNVPHIAGVTVAGNLHAVYAADPDDNIVYTFDEYALKPTAIPVGDNESPDSISYDPADHRVFVSDPGAPANPNGSANIDRKNQNVVVIDALKNQIVTKINIGSLPKLPSENAPTAPGTNLPAFGYDIGHSRYDAVQHRVFVTTQIHADLDSPNPNQLPPPGTGELMAIDPLSAKVVQRVTLPTTCETPHGMALDAQQGVAFIACNDVSADPSQGIFPNLARVDLTTMTVIPADSRAMQLAPAPDIVVFDSAQHVVFIGCRGGISVFDERTGSFHKLGDYQVGKNTHSIALDEQTQYLYVPVSAGGRPVLRVVRYNPSGA